MDIFALIMYNLSLGQIVSIVLNANYLYKGVLAAGILDMQSKHKTSGEKIIVLFDPRASWGDALQEQMVSMSKGINSSDGKLIGITGLTGYSQQNGKFSSKTVRQSQIIVYDLDKLYNHYNMANDKVQHSNNFGIGISDTLIVLDADKINNNKLNDLWNNIFDFREFIDNKGRIILISRNNNDSDQNENIQQFVENKYLTAYLKSNAKNTRINIK